MAEFKRGGKTTTDVYLKGKFKWVRHLQPDFTFSPEGKWSMVIYLSGEELEKAREMQSKGIKNIIKKDDDGWFMTLSRKCSYNMHGKVIARPPPEVFLQVGDSKTPITEMVGNGSDGIAKCVLWTSPNFPGANLRWEAARVDNLIPFNANTDYPNPEGSKNVADLAKQEPEALF